MLTSELVKKIKKVHIRSGRLVNTMMAGQYKSVFRGSGIEFEEVREYTPGDDVKNIDWMVSARLGRPFIKRYREERELIVMLLVDMSASGDFGTGRNLKTETAVEIASILAFNAIRNNDKVGAILFTDRVEKHIPPQKGSAHVWRVIKEILAFKPRHRDTDIQQAVQYLGRVSPKRTVSFLISDFLCGGFSNQLKVAGKKHDLIGVLLSDPGDFNLPEAGLVCVQDLESGEHFWLDASDKRTCRTFRAQKTREYRETLQTLKSVDMDCIEISTDGDVAEALTRFFRYRGKKMR